MCLPEPNKSSAGDDLQSDSKRTRLDIPSEAVHVSQSTSNESANSQSSFEEKSTESSLNQPPAISSTSITPDSHVVNKSDEAQETLKAHEHYHLSREEMERRLRERGEPVRLFGETDADVYARLQQFQAVETELQLKGYRNDFKMALDKVDEQYLVEIMQKQDQVGVLFYLFIVLWLRLKLLILVLNT